MFHGIIIHLVNDLPIVVDMEELPSVGDRTIRCTNVRTVDGKRPAFVHDRNSTFIFPLLVVRLLEVPTMSEGSALVTQDDDSSGAPLPPPDIEEVDEEAEEDLLARIRQI